MKPGIFDPWRQDPPKGDGDGPDVSGHVKTDLDQDKGDVSAVRFAGKRAGFTVWNDTWPADAQQRAALARQRIVRLATELQDCPDIAGEEMRRLFARTPIYEIWTDPNKLDSFAQALRRINARSPAAQDLLEEARVRPFIVA